VTNDSTGDAATRELSDGRRMPMLGFGVWQVDNGRECVDAVRWALEAGYRHIDTAQAYGNEQSVGQGLRDSGVPREDVFITTKFLPRLADPVAAIEGSLARLGVDYVDLYIVHWPEGGPVVAWPGMERAHDLGYARSIGVSNFGVDDLRQVLATARIPPVVDQVNFNPAAYRKALLDACDQNAIALEAYSPLGTGRLLGDKTVARIAQRHGRTSPQVLLRWCVEHGIPVIPKSVHRERIAANAQIFDFELSKDDMAELDALDRTGCTGQALERKWWRG
jgi:diketogulonate reductase-like aldo/keto reductase